MRDPGWGYRGMDQSSLTGAFNVMDVCAAIISKFCCVIKKTMCPEYAARWGHFNETDSHLSSALGRGRSKESASKEICQARKVKMS